MVLKYTSLHYDLSNSFSTNMRVLVIYDDVTLLLDSLIFKGLLKTSIYSFLFFLRKK